MAVPYLYQHHKGQFKVDETTFAEGDIDELTANQQDSINTVLDALGEKSGQWLSELTHQESPWKDSRCGLAPAERSQKVISIWFGGNITIGFIQCPNRGYFFVLMNLSN